MTRRGKYLCLPLFLITHYLHEVKDCRHTYLQCAALCTICHFPAPYPGAASDVPRAAADIPVGYRLHIRSAQPGRRLLHFGITVPCTVFLPALGWGHYYSSPHHNYGSIPMAFHLQAKQKYYMVAATLPGCLPAWHLSA